jgi:antitoxin component YwqK of YwqJK toxin-antitoxin module
MLYHSYLHFERSRNFFHVLSKEFAGYSNIFIYLWRLRATTMSLRAIILGLLFLCGVSVTRADSQSFTYQGKEVNKTDEQGKKQGHWVFLGKHKNLPGYAPEEPVEEGDYLDNRKTGIWISYYPGKKKKSEIEHKMDRPNGTYIKYYENGQIEEKGMWKGNKYVGSFERYHDNGQVAQKKNFNESGKTDGKVEYYFSNGKPEFVYNSKNGVEEGKATRYYENGDVKEELDYTGGQVANRVEKKMVNPAVKIEEKTIKVAPVTQGNTNPADGGKLPKDGYHKTYNPNQDLEMDGEFKNGKLWNGKWYKYDKNGLLYKIEIYKDGKYFGDGVLEF